jgi:hypothetical protein
MAPVFPRNFYPTRSESTRDYLPAHPAVPPREIPSNVTLVGSVVTVTGTSLVWACWLRPRVPLRYSYRHWNTWFAFTPCSQATRAIDAPGTNVASTIRRFSSGVRCNRPPDGAHWPTATLLLRRSSWDRQSHLSIRRKAEKWTLT